MNTITHALLPVLGVYLYRKLKSHEALSLKTYMMIALAGATPDLLNPHFTLEARLSSWSHSVFGLLGFSLVVLILSKWKSTKLDFNCGWILISAYVLHLFCDAIAGGIAFFYPANSLVIGDYYVSAVWWIPMDVAFFLWVYFIWRYPRLRVGARKRA